LAEREGVSIIRKGHIMIGGSPKNLVFLFGLFFSFGVFCFPRIGAARDPKPEEMGSIQEIASYLIGDTQQAYHDLSYLAGTNPQIDRVLPQLQRLNEKAYRFYMGLKDNEKSPWRTTRSYKELNKAFGDAREAFVQRITYSVSPDAFEEIAYLMEELLLYYLYPPGEGIIYSYQVQPQVIYPWIPTFYTFSTCHRFPFFGTIFPWRRTF